MFVCTGNICRSAMAEAMLKKIAQDKGKKVEVQSCGTDAYNGDFSTDEAIEVMKDEYNVDLKNHRAKNIMNADIQEFDLILCATRRHKIFVQQMFPNLKDKIFTIKEFAGENEDLDISDPWGYGIFAYRKCAEELNTLLNIIVDKI